MKKRVLLCLCALMLLMGGCAYKECDLCGEKGFGETKDTIIGEIFICKECAKNWEELKDNVTNLFN